MGNSERLVTRVRDVSATEEKPSKFISHGGLHIDDFQRIANNVPDGYVLVCFERELDGYHWKAIYTLNQGQFP